MIILCIRKYFIYISMTSKGIEGHKSSFNFSVNPTFTNTFIYEPILMKIYINANIINTQIKICIIEVYLLEYYFESHLIYKWRYYRQTIFSQSNIMVSYVDMIGLCHSVTILRETYVMRLKCHVRWLPFHFKRMLITGLSQ